MSLDFNFEDMIKRVGQEWYDAITTAPESRHLIGARDPSGMKWHPVTNRLIWACMAVHIGKITEDNVDEFYFRLRLLQKLDRPDLEYGDGTEINVTKQDVMNHIGLKTNVTTRSREYFVKGVMRDQFEWITKWPNGDGVTAFEMCNQQFEKYNKQAA